MRAATPFLLAVLILLTAGFGCRKAPAYVPAQETPDINVAPNAEGGKASTGGEDATIAPGLATEQLIRALPTPTGWNLGEVVETKNPVPLPDGTRAEYTTVSRTYEVPISGVIHRVEVTLTDTRGIPALTAFLDSFQERTDDEGFRNKTRLSGDQEAWLTYSYGPQREKDGQGSIVLLYRNRFQIQLDGEAGVSTELLAELAGQFHFDALH